MHTQEADAAITVYSDYVCPFCYLGKAALEEYRASADDPPAVEWHQFDLRSHKRGPDGEIDPDVEDGKDDEYFERVRENVERLRERYGVEMAIEASLDVDSWDAQKASLFVQQEYDRETFEAFNDAVFEALWRDERDVGDPSILAEIGEALDIPGEDIRRAIADEELETDLEERFAAAQRRGVTGIPTFAYGEYAARGAVPPAQLARLVDGA